MKTDKNIFRLYAVTDRSRPGKESLARQVEQAIKGGVTLVQLREKTLDKEAFLREAFEIKEICDAYGVPLIINDSVEIAGAADADGVHLGQGDMDVRAARAALGPDRILGVSARTVEQALLAEQGGADYLGVGAVFPTGTKRDAQGITLEVLREICGAVSVPAVAIGGITAENIERLRGSGIAGVAVAGAIFAQEDAEEAARRLLRRVGEIL